MSEAVRRSLHTEFSRDIYSKFAKAVRDYKLIDAGDRIGVCVSGGKDSMLMAVLFDELSKHSRVPFEPVYIVMDPGYSPENRARIERNAALLGISPNYFQTNIFDSVYRVGDNPCFLCSKMRRGHLYNRARELGCNKIALGHHFDDIIETILMSVIYGGQTETMMPKVRSAHFEGMQLIRPMYLVREKDIVRWVEQNGLEFIRCACRFTEQCESAGTESLSKRDEIKRLIATLSRGNPQVEMNIFRSVHNVNLKKIISYKKDGVVHSFLDEL